MSVKSTLLKSWKPLSVVETIKMKQGIGSYRKIEDGMTLNISNATLFHVINDKLDDGEYDNLILVDNDSAKYATCSKSFTESLFDAVDDCKELDADCLIVEVIAISSKNNSGKFFKALLKGVMKDGELLV